MKDYSFLSDSDESAAIEELLSQANDLCVLEQISAINCSAFAADDSLLPSDLENRFRRLKTFPSSSKPSPSPPPPTFRAPSPSASDSSNNSNHLKPHSPPSKPKSESKAKSANSATDYDSSNLSPLDEIPDRKREPKPKSRSRSFSPPLSSSDEDDSARRSSSPSPPRKPGCFWCSPKKGPTPRRKRSKPRALDWGKTEEVLSSFGASSGKEQKKLLKKIAKEEEKINREAEKIVKLAKQASARMNIPDDDSEDEVSG